MAIKIPYQFRNTGNKSQKDQELGIEDKFSSVSVKLLNDDGSFNIERKGHHTWNAYKFLVNMGWIRFFLLLIVWYLSINLCFALAYMIEGSAGIQGIDENTFLHELRHTFYFSIQTFTTVGYGEMNPVGVWSNIISVFNAFIGLMFFALATGLFFARFSMPRDDIAFAEKILVSPYNDGRALMIRFVNERDNNIVDLKARITMTWLVKEEGLLRRKFSNLELELERIYLFPLNWTLVHIIDDESPLYKLDFDNLQESHTEFLVMIKGFDDTYGKAIHSKKSYNCSNFIYGAKYVPMYETKDDVTFLHLDRINKIEKYQFDD